MSDGRKKRENMTEASRGCAERRPLPEWLAVKLDFPPDMFEGGLRLELRGRNSLLVHGCRRILQYAPEEMRLKMKGCVLCIKGQRLICHSYLAGAVGIEGKIEDICFCEEGEQKEEIC